MQNRRATTQVPLTCNIPSAKPIMNSSSIISEGEASVGVLAAAKLYFIVQFIVLCISFHLLLDSPKR